MSFLDKNPLRAFSAAILRKDPVSESDLVIYLVFIPNKDGAKRFNDVLIDLCRESGIRRGKRMVSVSVLKEENVYEIALTKQEAVILKLSAGGEFKLYNDKERQFMLEYLRLPQHK